MLTSGVPTFSAMLRLLVRVWMRRHRRLFGLLGIGAGLALARVVTGDPARGVTLLAMIGFYGAIAIALVTTEGLVSAEYRSGVAAFWYQKPGSIVRTYAVRYATMQIIVAGATVSLSAVLGVLAAATGVMAGGTAMRGGAVTVIAAVLTASIVFAFSAWNVRRDLMAALFVIIGSVTISAAFAFETGIVADALRLGAFPMDALGAISGSPAYAPGLVRPLVTIAAHLLIWNAIGGAGLVVTSRNLERCLSQRVP